MVQPLLSLGLFLAYSPCLVTAEVNWTVPEYVARYAPLLWLHSDDPFKPSDLATHVKHTTPMLDGKPIPNLPALDLDNLEILNKYGDNVALYSNDDPTSYPSWFYGEAPDENGRIRNSTPCVVVLVNKGEFDLDAFYFYFYSYNEGPNITQVLPPLDQILAGDKANVATHFGDHVGDWEHNMIRFHGGIPTGIYFSQHTAGKGYNWWDEILSKDGDRPIVYSARGSHANYITPGDQVRNAALIDYCDQGQKWDPVLSAYFYAFDPETFTFTTLNPPTKTDTSPPPFNLTSFLYFSGRWGDLQYPDSDPRQRIVPYFGLRRFIDGPTGPRDKQLSRNGIAPITRGRSWMEVGVAVFLVVYPYLFRGWRKWISLGTFVAFVSCVVLVVRYAIVKYKRRGYTMVGQDSTQLEEFSREDHGYTSDQEMERIR